MENVVDFSDDAVKEAYAEKINKEFQQSQSKMVDFLSHFFYMSYLIVLKVQQQRI